MPTRRLNLTREILLLTVFSSFFSLMANFAMADGTPPKAFEKRFYIGSMPQQNALKVDFKPQKEVYAVKQAIRFDIQSNKNIYLYLFNIDNSGRVAMILPNYIQGPKRNRYQSKQTFQVPNRNAEFYSDRAGTERVIMLASTKYLEEFEISRYQRLGNFYTTSAKSLQAQLKAIQVRTPQILQQKTEEIYIKEIDIPIVDSLNSAPITTAWNIDRDSKPAQISYIQSIFSLSPDAIATSFMPNHETFVYVATNRLNYHSGESVLISFGANQNGWLNLYSKDSAGDYQSIRQQAVQADQMNYFNIAAGQYQGEQEIQAVFATTKRDLPKKLAKMSQTAQDKAFRRTTQPITTSKPPLANNMAVTRFWVR